ncbi:MAG: type II toxin-antitoxin system death-on-curing family toxin [Patescibacteria group bacterium]
MRYLVAEEILTIHDLEIEKRGGVLGVRDFGLLYSIAERPKMSMMGQEFYPDVFSKAAAYLEGLATYHVFADGNKRTSFLATAAFLGLNGHDLIISNPKVVTFVLAVATKKKSMGDVAAWLKKHSKKIR